MPLRTPKKQAGQKVITSFFTKSSPSVATASSPAWTASAAKKENVAPAWSAAPIDLPKQKVEVVIYQNSTPPSQKFAASSATLTPVESDDDDESILRGSTRSRRSATPATTTATATASAAASSVASGEEEEDEETMMPVSKRGRVLKSKRPTLFFSDDEDDEAKQEDDDDDEVSAYGSDAAAMSSHSEDDEEEEDSQSSSDDEEESVDEAEEPPAKRRKASPEARPATTRKVKADAPKLAKGSSKKLVHKNLGADQELYGELNDDMDIDSPPEDEDSEMIDEMEVVVKPKKKAAKKKEPGMADNWKHKMGLAQDLKPISRIEDIFDDLTERSLMKMDKLQAPKGKMRELLNYDNADKNTLEDFIKHLNGRKLRLATMCSGTESPVLALEQVSRALRAKGLHFELDHQFSAEIVPYKQAYIERNFAPPIIFRDIKELSVPGATHATTAYGAKVAIPGDIDMLVTGFSCVDFSGLNDNKKTMEQFGESGDTFFAMRDYARVFRPKIIILENVQSAPWPKIGNYMSAIGYSCKHMLVDTKDYYIPHTRQRGYMMCVDMYEDIKKDKRSKGERKLVKDLKFAEYLKKFYGKAGLNTYARRMKDFERPASSSVEAFLLDVDDPRVVQGRMELSTNSRSETKRSVDWTRCQGRHEDYRFALGLGSRRYLTNWEDGGTMTPRDSWWADWWKSQVERIWDHMEMSYLRALARGYDIEYKFRIIDFSQNIDRSTDTGGAGLTGCVTPTGAPYSTMRGGPLIGLETLALQGLPIELLQLTREPQGHIKDLAGNAMSTTVVGASMLSALIARYHVFDRGNGVPSMEHKDKVRDVTEDGNCEHFTMDFAARTTMTREEAIKMAQQTFRACYCEDRFSLANAPLQKCKACGHTTCTDCGISPKHEYALWSPTRDKPSLFEAQLKAALPMKIVLDNITIDDVKEARAQSGFEFSKSEQKTLDTLDEQIEKALVSELRFHSLKRTEIWTASFISTFARLELVFFGNQAEWRLFATPDGDLAANSPVRFALEHPIAFMRPTGLSLIEGDWLVWMHKPMKLKATVAGQGEPVPSFKNVVGLMEQSNQHEFPHQVVKFEEDVSNILDDDLSGTYDLHQDCGMSQGSLHVKRSDNPNVKKIFLFHDPHRINDPRLDPFVFSFDKRRLQYLEVRPLLARVEQTLESQWAPLKFDLKAGLAPGMALVKGGKKNKEAEHTIEDLRKPRPMTLEVDGKWLDTKIPFSMHKETQPGKFIRAPADFDITPIDTCDESHVVLKCETVLPDGEKSRYHKGRWLEIGPLEYKEFFSEFAWLTEKVHEIPGLNTWRKFKGAQNDSHCEICAPALPDMKWKLDEKFQLVPFEDPKTAGRFENQLKNRPPPLLTQVLADHGKVSLKLGFNPQTLVHRAAAKLGQGEKNLDWRLVTDWHEPAKMIFPKFTLKNNDNDIEATKPKYFKMTLRPEQSRSLHWMISRESDDVEPFVEEEIEESSIPLLSWRAEGRARKSKLVRGGVLADQVGYGKTVTTLGLCNSMMESDNAHAKEEHYGLVTIKATLILVPKQLPDQWASEIVKFLGNSVNVIILKNDAAVAKVSIAEFEKADIIICSWDCIKPEQYLFKIAQFAGVVELPEKAPFRAQLAWYANAMKKVAENTEILKKDPQSLHEHVKADLEKEGGVALEAETYVPSKRLKGQAYQDYKAKLMAGRQDGILDLFGGDAPQNFTKEEKKAAAAKKFSGNKRTDVFNLQKLSKVGDYRSLKSPLFEMFRFSRVVVDEYAYVAGEQNLVITGLSARAKWILSGTPPLQDFLDVKQMAKFLGINLGIDDFTTGVMNAQNIKHLTKNMTSGEEFRTFKQKQSYAWHKNRHDLAQQFLNMFVRQNIADIEAIDGATHTMAVTLPAAERAIYIELQQLLAASDFKMVKGKRGLENHRMKRIRELLGQSEDVNQALVKCASYFDLDKPDGSKKKVHQDACTVITAIRTKQLSTLQDEIKKVLKQAEYLEFSCEDPCEQYNALVRQIDNNHFGDAGTCAAVTEMQKFAHENRKKKHWKEFYMTEEQQRQHDIDNPKVAKGKQKKSGSKRKREEEYDWDDEDIDIDVGEDPSIVDNKKPLLPQGRNGNVEFAHTALRDVTNTLRKTVVEYVARQRCLRFFHSVQALHTYASAINSDDDKPVEGIQCSACSQMFDPSALFVLSNCGHITCGTCQETHQSANAANQAIMEECLIPGCKAVNKSFQVIPAMDLVIQDDGNVIGGAVIKKDKNAKFYGKKINDLINLIQRIPKDEQIILFVQFPDLMSKIMRAFRDVGISKSSLDEGDPAKILTQFQNDTSATKARVLVLNIGDASAAGSNLTNANHVIFVSPYLTDREQTYHAAMTQAIGRARRYGQTKVVHTYHFLALKTIDVDVFEQNNHVIVDTNFEKQKFVPFDDFYKIGRHVGTRPDRKDGRQQQSIFGSTVANLQLRDD